MKYVAQLARSDLSGNGAKAQGICSPPIDSIVSVKSGLDASSAGMVIVSKPEPKTSE